MLKFVVNSYCVTVRDRLYLGSIISFVVEPILNVRLKQVQLLYALKRYIVKFKPVRFFIDKNLVCAIEQTCMDKQEFMTNPLDLRL